MIVAGLLTTQTSCATSGVAGMPCADPNVQNQRAKELQQIRQADQTDRKWQADLAKGIQPSRETLEKMAEKDLSRRMRVGEIFGESCLKSAVDYEAAYLVYQHGNTPDHYFQAFLWSKKALELGHTHIKGEIAMAIDRYLVSIGHKQLFGTQATQAGLGACFCIQPIEESFPQTIRDEYRGGKIAAYTGLELLKVLNGPTSKCPASYCAMDLQATPKGSVPGFW